MAQDANQLEPPIRAVIDATNKGNAKAFVAAFTKDAALSDWGEPFNGRAEIARWDKAENTGTHTRLKVTGVSRLAGEILVLLEITRGADADTQTKETATWSFRVKGPSVSSLEIG